MANNSNVDWTKDFKIPVYLILIGGIVSIFVGYSWEYFKFQRETLFQKRVDIIIENRKQASDLYIDFDMLRRQVRANEQHLQSNSNGNCDPSNFQNEVDGLRNIGLRAVYLEKTTKGVIEDDSISLYVSDFKDMLKEYISCIETNRSCKVCTDEYQSITTPLEKIVNLHTDTIKKKVEIE